ncbi:MAG: hypothetical protein AAFZ65_21235, partial [Planctomycetota bacterium]
MAVADLGRVEAVSGSPRAPSAIDCGWPIETDVTLDLDAPRAPAPVRIGDEARSAIVLRAGERWTVPLPRLRRSRPLELLLAGSGPSPLQLVVQVADGARPLVTVGELTAPPTGANWSLHELALPPADGRRSDATRLSIRVLGNEGSLDPSAWVAVAGLRLTPALERPAGPDLLVLCDERIAPDSTDPDEGPRPSDASPELVVRDCWATSPLPGPALVSLLTGLEPSVHRLPSQHSSSGAEERGPRRFPDGDPPRLAIAGAPGTPPTLGSVLGGSGYRTLLIAEAGTVAAEQPIDLGFMEVRVVPAGRALLAATEALQDPSASARA